MSGCSFQLKAPYSFESGDEFTTSRVATIIRKQYPRHYLGNEIFLLCTNSEFGTTWGCEVHCRPVKTWINENHNPVLVWKPATSISMSSFSNLISHRQWSLIQKLVICFLYTSFTVFKETRNITIAPGHKHAKLAKDFILSMPNSPEFKSDKIDH